MPGVLMIEDIKSNKKGEPTMADHGINRLETSMTNKVGSVSSFNSKCHIYTVPEYLRKGKEECYEPLIISIGPVFYNNSKLETMQDLKWKFLKLFLEHPDNGCQSLGPYLNFVKERIADIRVCYQREIKLSDDELGEMIVLDASFLIYLFMVVGKSNNDDLPTLSTEQPPIEENPFLLGLLYWVGRDLFLEENQLPFSVLTGIYEVAFSKVPLPRPSFVDLALVYISRLVSCIPGEKAIESIIRDKKITERDAPYIKHLVDLRRKCCCLSFKDQKVSKEERIFHEFPTAKQLSAAGVKFKSNRSANPLEITFDKRNGVLKIPKLTVYDSTEPVIRSILFFERCNCYKDRYFTDYIFFLDRLINTVEDIEVLRHNEILGNVLGSDEDAVELFNNLTKYISFWKSDFAFSEVSKDLKDYASTRWNRWKAILWSKYFNHPWAIISVSYAIILLILTVLQTIAGFTAK